MKKKQKVMSQMKGQDKIPEKELNEVEMGNQNIYSEDDPGLWGKKWREKLRRCKKCLPKTYKN